MSDIPLPPFFCPAREKLGKGMEAEEWCFLEPQDTRPSLRHLGRDDSGFGRNSDEERRRLLAGGTEIERLYFHLWLGVLPGEPE